MHEKEEFWLGGSFRANYNAWTGMEFEKIRYNNKQYYIYSSWVSFNHRPANFFGYGIKITEGKDLWYYDLCCSDLSFTSDYRKIDAWINVIPVTKLNITLKPKYRILKNAYIAKTFECKMKLQLNKSFWIREILQYENYDYGIWNYESKALNNYLLVAYQPSGNNAIYFGVNLNKGDEFQNEENIFQIKGITAFVKLSYTINMINDH